jgi:RNA polymerase sigma-70 factor (ECF subfamily)
VLKRRAGQTDVLRRVYREHVRGVYGFLSYFVDHTTAEDLTSGTFERVVRSWESFDPRRASERTWILTIARNLLTDHFRRSRHRESVSIEEHPALLEHALAPDDPLRDQLTTDELKRWLNPLGDRERTILALRYAADLDGSEIARVLGLTPANVHQILSRSLRRLREINEAGAPTGGNA